MDKRQVIAHQRAEVRKAIGILRGCIELFGIEDNAGRGDGADYEVFEEKVSAFEKWVFESSPIA